MSRPFTFPIASTLGMTPEPPRYYFHLTTVLKDYNIFEQLMNSKDRPRVIHSREPESRAHLDQSRLEHQRNGIVEYLLDTSLIQVQSNMDRPEWLDLQLTLPTDSASLGLSWRPRDFSN